MLSLRRFLLVAVGIMLSVFFVACAGNANGMNYNGYNKGQTGNTTMQPTTAPVKPSPTATKGTQMTYPSHNNGNTQNNKGMNGQTNNTYNNNQNNNTYNNNNQNNTGYNNNQNQNQNNNQNNNNQNNNNTVYTGNFSFNKMSDGNGNILVSLKQAMVNGQMTSVLTTFNGMTLYYYTQDMNGQSNCTGSCAKNWPPLLTKNGVISTDALPGSLTVQMTANGNQVEYNGHPLYMFAGDTQPGQANGQGVNNVWFVFPILPQKQHW